MKSNYVSLGWVRKRDKTCLHIEINGYLDRETASEAVERWKQEIAAHIKPGEKANIVCNCLNMEGYDTEARKLWQQTINSLKSQIHCLWIVTNNKLFVVAASTMGLITKFKIRTAASESEVCLN